MKKLLGLSQILKDMSVNDKLKVFVVGLYIHIYIPVLYLISYMENTNLILFVYTYMLNLGNYSNDFHKIILRYIIIHRFRGDKSIKPENLFYLLGNGHPGPIYKLPKVLAS